METENYVDKSIYQVAIFGGYYRHSSILTFTNGLKFLSCKYKSVKESWCLYE